MKEKTFEELIINIIDDEGNIRASDVHELLQQVREATIAECMEIAWKEKFGSDIHRQIASLEADRIKTEL